MIALLLIASWPSGSSAIRMPRRSMSCSAHVSATEAGFVAENGVEVGEVAIRSSNRETGRGGQRAGWREVKRGKGHGGGHWRMRERGRALSTGFDDKYTSLNPFF